MPASLHFPGLEANTGVKSRESSCCVIYLCHRGTCSRTMPWCEQRSRGQPETQQESLIKDRVKECACEHVRRCEGCVGMCGC